MDRADFAQSDFGAVEARGIVLTNKPVEILSQGNIERSA
jgi:hypothetical protein